MAKKTTAVETTPAQDVPNVSNVENNPPAQDVQQDVVEGEGEEAGREEPTTNTEPTSEHLTEIRATLRTQVEAMEAEKDFNKKLSLITEIQKTQALEKAEIANIKRLENEARVQALRNERIALIDNYVSAMKEEETFATEFSAMSEGDRAANMDKMNGLTDNVKKTREVLENALIAKFATVKPAATSTGTAATTATTGEKGKEIIDLYLTYKGEGKTDAEAKNLIEHVHNHARGTVGAVILKYQRANGLKA